MSDKIKYSLSVLLLIMFYSFILYKSINKNNTSSIKASLYAESNNAKQSIDQSSRGLMRAQIAVKEYEKGVKEDTKGCNCGNQVDIYTQGVNKQWCAMFVSWIFNEAETPLSRSKENWRISKARNIASYLESNGNWHSKEEIISKDLNPKVGDVMVFYRGNFEGNLGHADIVVEVNESKPGYASLIGGNLDDKVTLRKDFYYKDHFGLLGFGNIDK